MTDTLRIKRRAAGGAAGPPAVGTFEAAGLAFNEQDNTLYYGRGNSANMATSIIPIGGPGAFLPSVGGGLTGGVNFGSTLDASASSVAAHISLYGGNQYGFGITANRLNYNSQGAHVFLSGGLDKVTVNASGLSMVSGTDITLARDPSSALQAATMQYVDAVISRNGGPFLPTGGGTVSGATTFGATATFSAGGVILSGASTGGIAAQLTAHTAVGLDASAGVFTGPALRLAALQAISFRATSDRLLYYDGTNAPFGLKYGTGSVSAPGPVITLGDSGTVTAAGLAVSGTVSGAGFTTLLAPYATTAALNALTTRVAYIEANFIKPS